MVPPTSSAGAVSVYCHCTALFGCTAVAACPVCVADQPSGTASETCRFASGLVLALRTVTVTGVAPSIRTLPVAACGPTVTSADRLDALHDCSSVTPTNAPAGSVNINRILEVTNWGNVIRLSPLPTGCAALRVCSGTAAHPLPVQYCRS